MELNLPKVAALELTYRCNHQCIFCSCPWEADKTYESNELTFQEWTKVVDTLMGCGVRSFTLTGGEPLTSGIIRELIQYIASRRASLVLISNGRAMDDEFLRFIANYDVALCISVPGIKTFETHTGIDKGFFIVDPSGYIKVCKSFSTTSMSLYRA